MTDNIEHFHDLMARLRAGSNEAARELVNEFAPHVYRAVKRRFRHRRVQVYYATEDCVQSVWGAVFLHLDRVASCENPKKLIHFLACVARNKLIDRHREIFGRNNDGFENAEEGPPSSQLQDDGRHERHELTPSQQAVIREEMALRTKDLSSEKKTIFNLHNQGFTSGEICDKLDGKVSPRGIRRVIQEIFERFRG